MGVKKGHVYELEITDIAFGGKGFAKIGELAVFVDKAVTGDKVSAKIVKKKKNYAEAVVLELLKPSEDRIKPPCLYSGYCGGCKWQFLDYEKQLFYKTNHVRETIEHIGLLKDIPVHPAIGSPNVFGYRNKMEFSCTESRWLMPEELGDPAIEKGLGIGLHVPGTFHKVIDIGECHIQPDLGNRILSDIRNYIKASGVPVYGLKTHEGFWRFVMIRHSVSRDEWMINLITKTEDPDVTIPLTQMLMERYPNIVSVVNNVTSRKAGIAVGEYEVLLGGTGAISDKLGDYEFEISAGSFFQTNTRGAEILYEKVREYADLTGTETVIDLYSGTGTIPIFLSGKARKVIGIEIVESSVKDAYRNCEQNGVDNCRFLHGDIKECLPQISERPDVMIIDPPRAGMHKDVVAQVLAVKPERIVYVSCNPSTLARDLELMKGDYRVLEVQPVDMFPHTYHIEAVARLERI